jgi:hypothetical protein
MKIRPFSVVLLYPDYLSDGNEAYYGFVRAQSPAEAVSKAQMQAARAYRRSDHGDQDDLCELADDFKVCLVFKGHRKGVSWA